MSFEASCNEIHGRESGVRVRPTLQVCVASLSVCPPTDAHPSAVGNKATSTVDCLVQIATSVSVSAQSLSSVATDESSTRETPRAVELPHTGCLAYALALLLTHTSASRLLACLRCTGAAVCFTQNVSPRYPRGYFSPSSSVQYGRHGAVALCLVRSQHVNTTSRISSESRTHDHAQEEDTTSAANERSKRCTHPPVHAEPTQRHLRRATGARA